jgi:hypothetical protein
MTGRARIAVASRLFAGVATLLIAAVVAVISWRDAGAFTWALAGVPVVAIAPMLALTASGRPAKLATLIAAVVVVAWTVITGLGTGAYFAAPGVLLLLAALLTSAWQPPTGERPVSGFRIR